MSSSQSVPPSIGVKSSPSHRNLNLDRNPDQAIVIDLWNTRVDWWVHVLTVSATNYIVGTEPSTGIKLTDDVAILILSGLTHWSATITVVIHTVTNLHGVWTSCRWCHRSLLRRRCIYRLNTAVCCIGIAISIAVSVCEPHGLTVQNADVSSQSVPPYPLRFSIAILIEVIIPIAVLINRHTRSP